MGMIIDIEEMETVIDFAKRAAAVFVQDERVSHVTTSGFDPGALVAFRSGLLDDSVAVAKLDESFTPIIFKGLARKTDQDDGGDG